MQLCHSDILKILAAMITPGDSYLRACFANFDDHIIHESGQPNKLNKILINITCLQEDEYLYYDDKGQ